MGRVAINAFAVLAFYAVDYLLWVMASGAFRSLEGRMNGLLVKTDLLFGVAGIANLVALFLQDQLSHQAMPHMAVFALLLLDRRMNVLHPHVLVGELLMAVEAVPPAKPGFSRFGPRTEALFWDLRIGIQPHPADHYNDP